ncbi:MAG: 50S ribosomal protein L30e [Candidatus Micrarchaeota archaeon]
MNINKAIRMAVDTGDVKFGARSTIKNVVSGKSKMVIISNNCPRETREDLERNSKLSGVHLFRFGGTSIELGSLCGKPFLVSSMVILDVGDSNITGIVEEKAD